MNFIVHINQMWGIVKQFETSSNQFCGEQHKQECLSIKALQLDVPHPIISLSVWVKFKRPDSFLSLFLMLGSGRRTHAFLFVPFLSCFTIVFQSVGEQSSTLRTFPVFCLYRATRSDTTFSNKPSCKANSKPSPGWPPKTQRNAFVCGGTFTRWVVCSCP